MIVELKANVPQGSKAHMSSQKSEGTEYLDTLLPHEAYRVRKVKLKELQHLHAEERVCEQTSRFEVGQSFRSNQQPHMPDYVLMGKK